MERIVRAVGTVFMAVGMACMVAACGGGGGGSASGTTVSSSVQGQGVSYTLSAKAVSQQGENVALTLTTTNTGATTLDLASLLSALTIQVFDKDGAQVWGGPQSSTSSAFSGSSTLAPGASYDYVATWDQHAGRNGSGLLVAPGTYLVKATDGPDSVQVTITISGTGAAVNSLTIVPGGDGTYYLQANNLSGVAGMDLTINYDTSILTSPVVTQGALVSGTIMAANTSIPGAIRIAVVGATPFSGSGTIAILAFTVSTRNQTTPVISSVSMVNSSGEPVQ